LRFTSTNAEESIFIAAGTAVLSLSEVRFLTTAPVTLDRARPGGIAVAEVEAVADVIGTGGDTEAGAVCRVPVGLAARSVTVANPVAMRAGSDRRGRRVRLSGANAGQRARSAEAQQEA
jgi:hypothetical protein